MKKPIKNSILCAIASLTLLLAGTASVRADLIAYEGFDHPAATIGNMTGLSGGTDYPDYGWSGAWAHNYQITDDPSGISAGSTTWPGLVSHGNKLFLFREVIRSLGQTVGGTNETVWCASMFYATHAKRSAAIRFYSGTTKMLEVLSYRTTSNTGTIKLDAVDTGILAKVSQQFFLVRVDFSPAGNTAYLWVDPNLSSEPSIATANATKTYPANWTFNRVQLVGSGGTQSCMFDEIRIGTTFKDVLKPIGPPEQTVVVIR